MLFACWPLDDGVDVEVGADEAMLMGLVDIFVQPLPGNRDSLVFHSARFTLSILLQTRPQSSANESNSVQQFACKREQKC